MGADASKCCCAKDVKGSQKEIGEHPTQGKTFEHARQEEIVRPPKARPVIENNDGKLEWEILLRKKDGGRLGVNVDVTDGTSLIIDNVREGALMDFNRENPELAARQGDKILLVNGIGGDSQAMTDACKFDDTLKLLIQRKGEP
mmetsp:Transcript_35199/g.98885  ORF Transcript_35199/g.98885 Transcript_35199/m.98885 type:complete len:144 (-) Transcript_35199:122-553(-)